MTSVAYRDGKLVSDTQVNAGEDSDMFVGRAFKGGKTKDGYLWAMCGNAAHVGAMKSWVEAPEGEPPAWSASQLVLVTPEGVVREWDESGWIEFQAEYYAWGSGAPFALGAMAVGASAEQAVEAACRHDPWSSEPILIETLGEQAEEPLVTITMEDPGPQGDPDWREAHGLK